MCQMIRLSGDEINHLSAALTGTRPEMWHPQREIFPVRLWKVRPEAWVGGLPPCLYRRFTGSSAECSRHTTGAVSSPSRLCGGVISFHSLRYCPVNKGVQAFALSLCVGFGDLFLSCRNPDPHFIELFKVFIGCPPLGFAYTLFIFRHGNPSICTDLWWRLRYKATFSTVPLL